MLFEKLVEQHRVDCFIADRVRFAVGVVNNEGWIDLFHFFGYEAKLLKPFRINLLFVAESDRPQREESIACVAHALHILLKTNRGRCRANFAGGVYLTSCSCNCSSADAGAIRSRLLT